MWLSSRTFYSGDIDDPLPSPNAAEVQGTPDVPLNCLHRSEGEGEGLEKVMPNPEILSYSSVRKVAQFKIEFKTFENVYIR